jgi:hypothetical protein
MQVELGSWTSSARNGAAVADALLNRRLLAARRRHLWQRSAAFEKDRSHGSSGAGHWFWSLFSTIFVDFWEVFGISYCRAMPLGVHCPSALFLCMDVYDGCSRDNERGEHAQMRPPSSSRLSQKTRILLWPAVVGRSHIIARYFSYKRQVLIAPHRTARVKTLKVVRFSEAFKMGVPGGAWEEEQCQWALPIHQHKVVYTSRHLAVVLLLAHYQRLLDLRLSTMARAARARVTARRPRPLKPPQVLSSRPARAHTKAHPCLLDRYEHSRPLCRESRTPVPPISRPRVQSKRGSRTIRLPVAERRIDDTQRGDEAGKWRGNARGGPVGEKAVKSIAKCPEIDDLEAWNCDDLEISPPASAGDRTVGPAALAWLLSPHGRTETLGRFARNIATRHHAVPRGDVEHGPAESSAHTRALVDALNQTVWARYRACCMQLINAARRDAPMSTPHPPQASVLLAELAERHGLYNSAHAQEELHECESYLCWRQGESWRGIINNPRDARTHALTGKATMLWDRLRKHFVGLERRRFTSRDGEGEGRFVVEYRRSAGEFSSAVHQAKNDPIIVAQAKYLGVFGKVLHSSNLVGWLILMTRMCMKYWRHAMPFIV